VLSFSSDPACLFPEGGIVASPHQNLIFLYDLKHNVDMEPVDTHINYVADPMVRLAVSRDGRLLLSGQKKGTIILWDVESRRRLRAYTGHTDAVSALAFTPGGNRIVSASVDGSLRLWDLETGDCLHEMRGGAGAMTSLSLTADGKFCVTGDIGDMVKLWNLETGQWLHTFSSEHTLPVLAVCISPDNRHLLSGSSDKTVCMWEIDWELDV
jgi:WD40 repeat protein